jgi:hypothetical protein
VLDRDRGGNDAGWCALLSAIEAVSIRPVVTHDVVCDDGTEAVPDNHDAFVHRAVAARVGLSVKISK